MVVGLLRGTAPAAFGRQVVSPQRAWRIGWRMLWAALPCLLATRSALAGCERLAVARLALRDDTGFLSIPASIAGRPVRLMIDTGSDAGLITPQAVRRLGLAEDATARIAVRGTGGAGDAAGIARIARLSLGTLRLDNVLMPVGSLPAAPNLTPPVVGFLGGDLLSQFDLDIDVPHATLSLYRVELPSLACTPPPTWSGRFATVPLTAHGVRRSLTMRLDGKPVSALLDTGARSQIVSEAAALRTGASAAGLAADPGGITSGVDLREQIYHWHRFATLSIGDETVGSPVLTVAPLAEPFDMLLGSDWFAGHEAWISYATGELYFRSAGR